MEIAAQPEVAHLVAVGREAEVLPLIVNGLPRFANVKDGDIGVVAELGARKPYNGVVRSDRGAIAGRVLVDGYHFRIGEQRFRLRVCLEQIAAHDQRRAEDGPQRTLFVVGEPRIARLALSWATTEAADGRHVSGLKVKFLPVEGSAR